MTNVPPRTSRSPPRMAMQARAHACDDEHSTSPCRHPGVGPRAGPAGPVVGGTVVGGGPRSAGLWWAELWWVEPCCRGCAVRRGAWSAVIPLVHRVSRSGRARRRTRCSGRISRLLPACCSMTCAVQAIREMDRNTGVEQRLGRDAQVVVARSRRRSSTLGYEALLALSERRRPPSAPAPSKVVGVVAGRRPARCGHSSRSTVGLRSRVPGTVDPVPEAWLICSPRRGRSRCADLVGTDGGDRGSLGLPGLPDRLEPAHDLLVGPAVQRAAERAERRDHGRVHVGQRGRADPGRERGRVHGVVGVQHQAGVEDLGRPRAGRPAR